MLLLFWSNTYICEYIIVNVRHIKSIELSRLTDKILKHLHRISASDIKTDFATLSFIKTRRGYIT